MNEKLKKIIVSLESQKPKSRLNPDAFVGISESGTYNGNPEALSQEAGW